MTEIQEGQVRRLECEGMMKVPAKDALASDMFVYPDGSIKTGHVALADCQYLAESQVQAMRAFSGIVS